MILLILTLLTYIFLIKASFDLKKDDRLFESVKFLTAIGIILLIWTISTWIPMYYYITLIVIINEILHLILGIVFCNFGRKNREDSGRIILSAGIIYSIAWGLNLMLKLLFLVQDPAFFDIVSNIYLIFSWVLTIMILHGAIFILIYSLINKRGSLIIFGALFVSLHALEILFPLLAWLLTPYF